MPEGPKGEPPGIAAAPVESASLRAAASRSVMWTAIGKLSNTLISLLVTALLARLLSPADFGIIAMVVVISGFLGILAEAGVSTAVVQKRDLDERALSSLFWAGLGIGGAAASLLAASAPLVAWFFAEPRLRPVVALLGIGFVCLSLGRIPNGLLERRFQFRLIALAEVLAALVSGVVGVVLAFRGAGYFALVAQTLSASLLNAVLRLYFSKFRPRFVFDAARIKAISGYSGAVTAFSAINYWARNLDKALIGRALGAADLGFYGRAYALMMYPLEGINGIINPSLHPILSSLQGDPERMTRAYIKIAKLVAMLALPAMCVLGALAPELVHTVWGPQWDPSVRVFAILCFVGSVQPVGSTFGAVFLATNRTRFLAVLGLVNAVIIMTGIALGVRFGIEGVAIGYSIAYATIFFPTIYVVLVVLLRDKVTDIARVLGPALLVALPVLLSLLGYNHLLRGRWGEVAHLLAGAALGILVWLAAFAVLDRELFREARSFLPAPLRGRARPSP